MDFKPWKTEGLQGSQTEQNLLASWHAKSRSKMLFTYFAYAAMHEGFQQLSEMMEESARNETMHSKLFYMSLYGPVPDTQTNIRSLLASKRRSSEELLPAYAQTARQEGWDEAAWFFDAIAKVDASHVKMYTEILSGIKNDRVFNRENECAWVCQVCGYETQNTSAPDVCPLCTHDRRFFSAVR